MKAYTGEQLIKMTQSSRFRNKFTFLKLCEMNRQIEYWYKKYNFKLKYTSHTIHHSQIIAATCTK